MKKLWQRFEDWFELKFGIFFVNGMKVDKWKKYMREKHNIEN